MDKQVLDPGLQGAPAENWEAWLSRPWSLPWSFISTNQGLPRGRPRIQASLARETAV